MALQYHVNMGFVQMDGTTLTDFSTFNQTNIDWWSIINQINQINSHKGTVLFDGTALLWQTADGSCCVTGLGTALVHNEGDGIFE